MAGGVSGGRPQREYVGLGNNFAQDLSLQHVTQI